MFPYYEVPIIESSIVECKRMWSHLEEFWKKPEITGKFYLHGRLARKLIYPVISGFFRVFPGFFRIFPEFLW